MDIDPETISGTEVDKWFVSRPTVIQFSINEAVEKEYISLKGQETRYTIQRRHIVAAMRMSARIEEAKESKIVDETGAVDEEFTALLKSMRWFEKQSESVHSAIDQAVDREYNEGSERRYIIYRRHLIAAMRASTLDVQPRVPTVTEVGEWFAQQPESVRFNIDHLVDEECTNDKKRKWRYLIQRKHIIVAMNASSEHEAKPETGNKATSPILRDVIDPHIRIEGKCGSCKGTGESLTVHGWSKEGDPCYVCEGSGRVSKLVRVGDLASLLSLLSTSADADEKH